MKRNLVVTLFIVSGSLSVLSQTTAWAQRRTTARERASRLSASERAARGVIMDDSDYFSGGTPGSPSVGGRRGQPGAPGGSYPGGIPSSARTNPKTPPTQRTAIIPVLKMKTPIINTKILYWPGS